MCFYVILSFSDFLLYIIVHHYNYCSHVPTSKQNVNYGTETLWARIGSMHFAKTVAAELEIYLIQLEVSLIRPI